MRTHVFGHARSRAVRIDPHPTPVARRTTMRNNRQDEFASHPRGACPPDSVAPAPAQRINRLTPFVHVEDVARSIAFYHHLGLTLASVYKYRGTPVWASLTSGEAELMVTRDGDPIDPAGQGVLFYLYSDDLRALRDSCSAAGIAAGEIEDGTPGPTEQMQIIDPDGYELMIAQTD